MEHLAKAVLARRQPGLIVASSDFESLLRACGEGGATRPRRDGRPARMRTIGASEAVTRAGRFVATLEALVPSLELLIDVRNGVAHLGEVTAADADSVLVTYLKASEAMRAALGIDEATYWGEFVSLVDTALKENVEEVRVRVETKLANARDHHWTAILDDEQARTAARDPRVGVPSAMMLSVIIAASAHDFLNPSDAWKLHVDVDNARKPSGRKGPGGSFSYLTSADVHRVPFMQCVAFRHIRIKRELEWPHILAVPRLDEVILRVSKHGYP